MLPAEIPWQELAFPSITFTLERYVEDLKKGSFGMHVGRYPATETARPEHCCNRESVYGRIRPARTLIA